MTVKEKNFKAIAKMKLMNDTFMSAVFDNNIKGTELLLNIILNRTDMIVNEFFTQREYKSLTERSIKLDIYAKDSSGKVYDIEVQRENAGACERRARFHSSMLDTKLLKKRQDFSELIDTYVIFITEKDVMKQGLPIYHIDRKVE